MLTSRHLFAVGKFPKPAMPDWFVCFYGWHVTGENVFFVHSGSGSTSLSLTLNWPITYILRASKRQFTTLHYDDDQLHWRTSCPSRSAQWPTEGRRDVMAFARCFVVRNVSSYADFADCSAGMIQFALLVEFGPYASLAGDNRSVLSTWREIR